MTESDNAFSGMQYCFGAMQWSRHLPRIIHKHFSSDSWIDSYYIDSHGWKSDMHFNRPSIFVSRGEKLRNWKIQVPQSNRLWPCVFQSLQSKSRARGTVQHCTRALISSIPGQNIRPNAEAYFFNDHWPLAAQCCTVRSNLKFAFSKLHATRAHFCRRFFLWLTVPKSKGCAVAIS